MVIFNSKLLVSHYLSLLSLLLRLKSLLLVANPDIPRKSPITDGQIMLNPYISQ